MGLSLAACSRQLDTGPAAASGDSKTNASQHQTHSEKKLVNAGAAGAAQTQPAGEKKPEVAGSPAIPAKAPMQRAAAAGRSGSSAADSSDAGLQKEDASTQPLAPTQCQPRAGTYVVLEGEELSVNLRCDTADVSADAWELDDLPAGANFDPATGTLRWRPALDQAARYQLTARALPSAETATLEISVIDAYDAEGNEPPLDPTQYLEEYGLPVLHLTTDPGVNDDAYTPATIVYRGHTYAGAEAKFRGATSKWYPKRSFTLKFTKQDKFNEPSLAGGFRDKRKITLITSFDDNSYVRQRLGYELWNRLDPKAHIRVQSYNAVVFLDGKYHGLYTIADHIDGYLMEDFGYDQDGNLYKARSYDGNFRATSGVSFVDGVAQPKATLHDGFSKEEGTPAEGEPGAFDDLDAFVDWAVSSSAEDFAKQIDTTIARKEYEDWWIWCSYIHADDSAGKNSYHYHDPLRSDSVWHYVPWDLNASFGQDWKTMRSAASASPPDAWFRSVNGLFDRILADAEMGPALEARYGRELRGPLAGSSVLALFDAMVKEIDQSALRDEKKWQSAYRDYTLWRTRSDFTTYREEVEYVRRWIAERQAYLEGIYASP